MSDRRPSRDALSPGMRSYLRGLGTPPRLRGSKSHVRPEPRVAQRPITLPHVPFLDRDDDDVIR